MTNQRQPAEVQPPGVHIQEELNERKWTWLDLCDASGLTILMPALVDVMQGEPISESFANGLAKAFGTSPELWLNLQARWDEYQTRIRIQDRREKGL